MTHGPPTLVLSDLPQPLLLQLLLNEKAKNRAAEAGCGSNMLRIAGALGGGLEVLKGKGSCADIVLDFKAKLDVAISERDEALRCDQCKGKLYIEEQTDAAGTVRTTCACGDGTMKGLVADMRRELQARWERIGELEDGQ